MNNCNGIVTVAVTGSSDYVVNYNDIGGFLRIPLLMFGLETLVN
jgi:hypothetical protein